MPPSALQELREKRTGLIAKAREIEAVAAKADTDLDDGQSKQFNVLLADADTLKSRIERAERLDALEASLDRPTGRRTQPESPPEGMNAMEIDATAEIRIGKDRFEDSPSKGFKGPRDFIYAVLKAGQDGNRTEDKRLRFLGISESGVPIRAATGSDEQGTYSDPYGGFMVPTIFSPDVLRIDPEDDPMAGRTRLIPMEKPELSIPARVDKNHTSSVSGGLTVTRREETGSMSSSRMELERVKLEAYSLFGLSYITEELLTDSPMSFAAIIEAGFRDQFTSHLIDERLNGTGVGEFLGIMNSGSLVSITKETNQVADTIKYANIVKMRARVWGYQNAIWMANHDTIPELMQMNVEVGVGGAPVWQPSAREDHPDLLLGRPLIFTEYAKKVGDKGDIVCANWREFLEGVYQPFQSAESIHVRFLNHERTFKFWLRNAGTPWWRTALTPKNSTDTLSPFVTLNARA